MYIYTLTNILSKIIATLFAIFIVKILPPVEYGIFSVALSYLAIGVAVSDLGLQQTFTREINRSKNRSINLFIVSIAIRLLLLIAFFPVVYILTDLKEIYVMYFCSGLGMLLINVSNAYFISKNELDKNSWIKAFIIFGLIISLTISYFHAERIKVENVVVMYSFTYLISGVIATIYIIWKDYSRRYNFSISQVRILLFGVVSLCGSLLIFSIQPIIGILLTEQLSGLEYSAAYSLSYRFVTISLMVVIILSQIHMSKIYKFKGNYSLIRKETVKQILVNIFLNILITFVLYLILDEFIDLLLDGKNQDYIDMVMGNFYITSCLIIISAISLPLGQQLLALDKQTERFKCQIISLISLIILIFTLNYLSIVYYAAISLLIAESILLLLYILSNYNEKNSTC
ncbi:TPA: lipopolysaccharide biosynthesis protein [Vibrio diabolicus]